MHTPIIRRSTCIAPRTFSTGSSIAARSPPRVCTHAFVTARAPHAVWSLPASRDTRSGSQQPRRRDRTIPGYPEPAVDPPDTGRPVPPSTTSSRAPGRTLAPRVAPHLPPAPRSAHDTPDHGRYPHSGPQSTTVRPSEPRHVPHDGRRHLIQARVLGIRRGFRRRPDRLFLLPRSRGTHGCGPAGPPTRAGRR